MPVYGDPEVKTFAIVRVFENNNKTLDTCVELQQEENFAQLFHRAHGHECEVNSNNLQAFISQTAPPAQQQQQKHGTQVPLFTPAKTLVKDFSCNHITYYMNKHDSSDSEKSNSSHQKQNAFVVMMNAQKEDSYLPPKISKDRLIATEKLHNLVIDYMQSVQAGFTHDYVRSCGRQVVTVLKEALWYLDAHHTKFQERSIKIPKPFQCFQNMNRWKENKHPMPKLTQEGLHSHEQNLAGILMLPVVLSQRNSTLVRDLSELCEAIRRYRLYLREAAKRVEGSMSSSVPVRSPPSHSKLTTIPASAYATSPYQELQKHLDRNMSYTPVNLGDFSPTDRYERRKYIANLQLTSNVSLYSMSYGNNLGTITIIWKVEPQSENHETRNAAVIQSISRQLPVYSTREMRRTFIQQYSDKASIKPMVLRHLYRYLTNDSASAESVNQEEIDDRVVRFFLETEQPDLLLDLRTLNGNPGSTLFQPFWEEVAKYVEEHGQVCERRHQDQHLYMPLAVSIEDLRLRIKERLPEGTPVPSAEWLRLQFWPPNPYAARAVKHTFRFDVKFAVQTRLLRAEHVDSKYAATQWKYLKHFACMYSEHARMICVDDKSIVPVGNPGQPVSTGVRGHNRSLVPVGGTLAALDHDWHVGGLVPSVVLCCEIPERPEDTFFRGKLCVTVKEKVFQPSSPRRHAVETVRVLRKFASSDDVNLDVPILLIYSDGGPDHRVTFKSVQITLLVMFIALDLDALIAARCAPHGSWVNPAERCMSLLNLALQNVALQRGSMSEELEKVVKNLSDLKSVRQAADRKEDLREGFKASMQPVIQAVTDRFKRMYLKGEKVETFEATEEEDIEELMGLLAVIDDNFTEVSKSEKISRFMERHSKQTHYTFQLRKCLAADCAMCTLNPPRLPPDVFQSLSFLPQPMLDRSREHYLPFSEVYGKESSEVDRPSRKQPTERSEDDKRRKSLLVSAKARDVIRCAECRKPRCVYSHTKLTVDQQARVQRAKEDRLFVCGGDLFAEGGRYYDNIVVRRDMSCATSMETQYYSAAVTFPDLCYHCGSQRHLLGPDDPYMADLRQTFSTVRPICSVCRAGGREAKTRGPLNAKKRQRRT